jgi:hypothetical protein
MNYKTLNTGEKTRLVMTILETIDEPMEFDDFQETIGLMTEDIPGLEGLSVDSFLVLVTDCWEIFQQTPLSNTDNR